MSPLQALRTRYRASGADAPYGDPLRAHGVAMEGYFWRITDPSTGRVVIALIGINRGPRGAWSTLGLAGASAGTDGGALQVRAHPEAFAHPERLHASAGDLFAGDDRTLAVDLGDAGRLDVAFSDHAPWPRTRWGGSSVFHAVPALNQYWHPWLLGGRVEGAATLDGETWEFDGAQLYAEKNWGKGGFPDAWWWGQAQGFAEPEACVAFAGGEVTAGPLRTTVTALVVRLPGGRLLRLGDPVVSPVRTEVTDTTWSLRGRGFGWRVEVEAAAPLGDAHVLPVPLPREHRNTAGAIEHLTGDLSIVVRRGARVVWRGETRLAGLEHGGLARSRAEIVRRGAPPEADHAPPVGGPRDTP